MEKLAIKPKDDARFAVLRGDAEINWREWNPTLVALFEQNGTLQTRLDKVAERAVELLLAAEKAGAPSNQAQELVNDILFLPAETMPEDEELESQPF